MSPVVSAEIVAGALILLALFALTYIFVRRRLLASGAPLMLCALQPHGRSQYRLGLLRFSGTTLEWFTLIGPSPARRPAPGTGPGSSSARPACPRRPSRDSPRR